MFNTIINLLLSVFVIATAFLLLSEIAINRLRNLNYDININYLKIGTTFVNNEDLIVGKIIEEFGEYKDITETFFYKVLRIFYKEEVLKIEVSLEKVEKRFTNTVDNLVKAKPTLLKNNNSISLT